MAEIQESGGGGGKHKGSSSKRKKLSTRIDLTPMVDLGFLLITFFIFTTTMSKPKTMEINMPVDKEVKEEDKNKVKDYTAMTVLLSREHRVYYYLGLAGDPQNPPDMKVTYFRDKDGIRQAIMDLKKKVDEEKYNGMPGHNPTDQPVVLIKADSNSLFDDLVNILDEMNVNAIETYALVDITDIERGFIKETEIANGVAN